MVLENDGKGKFTDITKEKASVFTDIGMCTDALWIDVDGDKSNELIVAGEWSILKAFRFEQGKFVDVSEKVFAEKLSGWWNRLAVADLDGDGDEDLVAGNWGENSQLHAAKDEPVELFYADFDDNGYIDPIVCYYIQGSSYPMATRDEMTDQIVSLRQKFPKYDVYADARLADILSDEQLKKAKLLKADHFKTTWFENVNGVFQARSLPVQADYAPVHAIRIDDFNKDGKPDILLAGNVEQTRIKIGKIDANHGVLLLGDGKGGFRYVDQSSSGLKILGCVRDLVQISDRNGRKVIMAGINNGQPIFLTY
jgi:hypothetical protein